MPAISSNTEREVHAFEIDFCWKGHRHRAVKQSEVSVRCEKDNVAVCNSTQSISPGRESRDIDEGTFFTLLINKPFLTYEQEQRNIK